MPKGPNGQKRPADVIGAAVMVGKIATGEIEDDAPKTVERPALRPSDSPSLHHKGHEADE